jgi:hypothetical protein
MKVAHRRPGGGFLMTRLRALWTTRHLASNSTQAERRRGLNGYGDRESRYAAFPLIAAMGWEG